MSKRGQHTKLILQTNLEEIDLSRLCIGMNLPRTPGEIETVQVELAIDRLSVNNDGTLVVYIRED